VRFPPVECTYLRTLCNVEVCSCFWRSEFESCAQISCSWVS